MNTRKYSVIIPIYNQERLVMETIESVLKAIRNCDEVILVDDCSTDNSFQVILGYNCYEQVKVYKNQCNQGHVKTINYGISKAEGDYIIIIGGDDLLGEGFVNSIERINKEEIDVYFPPVIDFFDSNSVDLKMNIYRESCFLSLFGAAFGWGKYKGSKYSIIGAVFKKKSILENGMFSTDVVIEDHDFFFRALRKNMRLKLVGGICSFYRKSPNSMSRNMKKMLMSDWYIINRNFFFPLSFLIFFRRLISFSFHSFLNIKERINRYE